MGEAGEECTDLLLAPIKILLTLIIKALEASHCFLDDTLC